MLYSNRTISLLKLIVSVNGYRKCVSFLILFEGFRQFEFTVEVIVVHFIRLKKSV